MANGSFWLTLLLLVTIIMAKDVYISGLERNFNFKPQHIIQEIEVTGKGHRAVQPDEPASDVNIEMTNSHVAPTKSTWENNFKLNA